MSQISDIQNPWRTQLLSAFASFRGIKFHIETGSKSSGRRTVTHEYPKRNLPYAEDMGRHAFRFAFSGYLIYNPQNRVYEYTSQRKRLQDALELDDVGKLIHPVFTQNSAGGMDVICERYSMIENREKGGFTQFEMQFVEAGSSALTAFVNTVSNVISKGGGAEQAVIATFNNVVRGISK